MYIDLDKKYLKKNWKRMEKAAEEEFTVEDRLLDENLRSEVEIGEFADGILCVNVNSDVGFMSIDVPISDDLIFDMIEYLKEKGERLNRLIKLTNANKVNK